jgi:streptogrisin D
LLHRHLSKRKAALIGTGVIAVAALAILLPNANASPPTPAPKSLTPAAAVTLAARLTSQLGADTAGTYYDPQADHLVVNVLDDAAADTVSAAGAVAKTVENSTAKLTAAARVLKQRATIPGTSWSVDPRANQLLVTVDNTVTGAKWRQVEAVVTSLGDGTARIHRSMGRYGTLVAGGEAVFGGGPRCSLGFNVVKAGKPFFLTAGHCGAAIANWSDSQNGVQIGRTRATTFPGAADFALVQYTDAGADHPSVVDLGKGRVQQITRAADPTVGQSVVSTGSTTGVHNGTVTGLDATVNYPEGTVTGLIQTDICAEPGDSGGPLFSGDTALGLTSGGSGDCTTGGETFFQPVTAALGESGAEIG